MKKIIYLRNLARILGLSSIMVVALGFGAGLAKASVNVGGGNDTTGPNSENENEWSIHNRVNVDIANRSSADNDQSFEVATGNTRIDQNTEVDGLSSGWVWGTIDVANELNSGDIQLMSMDPGNVNVDFGNDTTGPNSENSNELNLDLHHDVDISNSADIDNSLALMLGTGNNSINHNTVVGDVSTGNIQFEATINNSANHDAGTIDLSGMGGLNVSGDFSNMLTGPQSSNENEANINSSSDISISNSADIDNNTEISANTGGNTIDHNTVVGDVSTGNVFIDLATTNSAN